MAGRAIRVADEVWIATALLHRDEPERDDFSSQEILRRAARENLRGTGALREGVKAHVSQHCVAQKPPNPGRYRMLVETARGRRRLYRSGDPTHPERRSGKSVPNAEEIPNKYRELLDWYRDRYDGRERAHEPDPILGLRGLGKEIWDEDPDAYVGRLRAGWE